MKSLNELKKAIFRNAKPDDDLDAYELLSNSLPFGVSLIDPDLNILRSNRTMREWFPSLQSGQKQKCFEAFNQPPRKTPCPECALHRDPDGKRPSSFVRKVNTGKGTRSLKLRSVPIHDARGTHTGYLEIAEDVTEAVNHEALQKQYLDFLEMIARISAQIVHIEDSEWGGEILSLLRRLGEFFHVDRCCLFELDSDKNLLTNTHEWCAPGVSSQIEYMQEMPESTFPWWFKELKAQRQIYFPDIQLMPPEAGLEKQELIRQDIKSILYFPMRDENDTCIGCIGFDSVQAARTWPQEHISMLNLFTSFLTGTLLRKKHRDDLQHRERQYRQLFENTMNSVLSMELVCDVDGSPLDLRIQSANPRACSLLGRAPSDLVDRRMSDVFPDLNTPPVLKWITQVIRTGEAGTFELSTRGDERHFLLNAFLLNGLRFGMVIADHTGREKAMRALQKKTDELESYFNSSLDMLCVLTPEGRFIGVNPEWKTVMGYEPGALAGEQLLSLAPPADQAKLREYLKAAFSAEHAVDFVVEARHADGKFRWLELRARSIGARLYASARDITARKLAEEERTLLEAQLHQALKMESIGRLAGGVAHDFNNTLQVILGSAEMALKFQNPTPALKENLTQIQDAAKRSSQLTRQLLAFARKQKIEPVEVQLNQTLSGMMGMLKRLISERIQLLWRPGENLWSVFIDPGQVDQLIANLCVNANDAIENEGTIEIRTENVLRGPSGPEAKSQLKPGEYVKLSVRDSGSGIPEEIQTRIFEPFMTTKSEGKGTGLGLATVHGIVLQNQGEILLESTSAQGTCFAIYLPRHHAEAPAEAVKPVPEHLPTGSEHVLIVEDEPMILQMTELTLKKLGYSTSRAASPMEALALTEQRRKPLDLLLTDVVMPEMDGKELSRILTEKRPGLKTLFMSGYTHETMQKYGITEADTSFIQKPFSVNEIARALRAVLDDDPPLS